MFKRRPEILYGPKILKRFLLFFLVANPMKKSSIDISSFVHYRLSISVWEKAYFFLCSFFANPLHLIYSHARWTLSLNASEDDSRINERGDEILSAIPLPSVFTTLLLLIMPHYGLNVEWKCNLGKPGCLHERQFHFWNFFEQSDLTGLWSETLIFVFKIIHCSIFSPMCAGEVGANSGSVIPKYCSLQYMYFSALRAQ